MKIYIFLFLSRIGQWLCKFVDEIDKIYRIYFGNIVIEINLRDDINYSDINDEDDEDCESDKENTDSNTSNIGMECSELDLCQSEKQKHFMNQTWCIFRFFFTVLQVLP
jgi:hypothetical protein